MPHRHSRVASEPRSRLLRTRITLFESKLGLRTCRSELALADQEILETALVQGIHRVLLVFARPPAVFRSTLGVSSGPQLSFIIIAVDDGMSTGLELFLDHLGHTVQHRLVRAERLRLLPNWGNAQDHQIGFANFELHQALLLLVAVAIILPSLIPDNLKAQTVHEIFVPMVPAGVGDPHLRPSV